MVVGKKHCVSWIIFASRWQWSIFITKYLLQTELKKKRGFLIVCGWENNLIVLLVIIWQHFKPLLNQQYQTHKHCFQTGVYMSVVCGFIPSHPK